MYITIIIVCVLVALLALAWSRPDTIRIVRAADIHATPERIFGLINDFRNWPAWSPQDKMDSTMIRINSGESCGAGAISIWKGKGQAGCGEMKITESAPPNSITVQVDFAKPFTVRNINQFSLQKSGDLTRVTWTMQGGTPFIAKLMSLVFNMERMFGKHFESGLDNLRRLAENGE